MSRQFNLSKYLIKIYSSQRDIAQKVGFKPFPLILDENFYT
jgi:hypothetical protein